MNKVILMGRLTKDPEIRGGEKSSVARFPIAVERQFKKDGDTADFFDITAFGKQAEFAGKHLTKGVKILLSGRIENNNYTGKDGKKVYSNQIIAESIEFTESKKAAAENTKKPADDGFLKIPDDIADEDLPFN